MSGLSCAAIACSVAAGTRSRWVNSTESPDRAAHAAAARSVAGSLPAARTVLRVATTGKPRFAGAWLCGELGAGGAVEPTSALSPPELPPTEQPASTAADNRSTPQRIGGGPYPQGL